MIVSILEMNSQTIVSHSSNILCIWFCSHNNQMVEYDTYIIKFISMKGWSCEFGFYYELPTIFQRHQFSLNTNISTFGRLPSKLPGFWAIWSSSYFEKSRHHTFVPVDSYLFKSENLSKWRTGHQLKQFHANLKNWTKRFHITSWLEIFVRL